MLAKDLVYLVKYILLEKIMNIILYFSDQQRFDTINKDVTPNIEGMLDESIFFDNTYTMQPVCGPARACIQTGLYASENECYINYQTNIRRLYLK